MKIKLIDPENKVIFLSDVEKIDDIKLNIRKIEEFFMQNFSNQEKNKPHIHYKYPRTIFNEGLDDEIIKDNLVYPLYDMCRFFNYDILKSITIRMI